MFTFSFMLFKKAKLRIPIYSKIPVVELIFFDNKFHVEKRPIGCVLFINTHLSIKVFVYQIVCLI